MLAADRRCADGNGRLICDLMKLRRLSDGRLVAAAGDAAGGRLMMDWVAEQSQPRPNWQDNEDLNAFVLEVMPDGTVMRHEEVGAFPVGRGPTAIGTGASYALAAMACGKTAAEAVEIAARFDVWTGGGVDVLMLGENA